MNICQTVIYFCDQSCIFSIITPVFSVTWSSEIIIICWFAAQETFLMIINVKNINIFVETVTHFIFQDSQMNRKFKRTAFIWIFCIIINIVTVTFDQFNASLMNKSIKTLLNSSVCSHHVESLMVISIKLLSRYFNAFQPIKGLI